MGVKSLPGRGGVGPCAPWPGRPQTGGCIDFRRAVVLIHGNNQPTMQSCLSKGLKWHLGSPEKMWWGWRREGSSRAWQDDAPGIQNHLSLLKIRTSPQRALASPFSGLKDSSHHSLQQPFRDSITTGRGLLLTHAVAMQRQHLPRASVIGHWSCHVLVCPAALIHIFGFFHYVAGGCRRSLSALCHTLSLAQNAMLWASDSCAFSIQEGWRNLSCQEVAPWLFSFFLYSVVSFVCHTWDQSPGPQSNLTMIVLCKQLLRASYPKAEHLKRGLCG